MIDFFYYLFQEIRIFNKNEKGSFTIEASLIFPIIFLITLAMLLISIVIYEQVYFYYIASQAAERSTYSWNNSHKDPYTGAFPMGEYDGLYWRLSNDSILGIFLNDDNQNRARVSIGEVKGEQLTEKKLSNIAVEMPGGIDGELIYFNNIIERRVTTNLQSRFKLPSSIRGLLGSDQIRASASSTVADPVEFIRTVNLITENANRLTNENKEKSKAILNKQKETDK